MLLVGGENWDVTLYAFFIFYTLPSFTAVSYNFTGLDLLLLLEKWKFNGLPLLMNGAKTTAITGCL